MYTLSRKGEISKHIARTTAPTRTELSKILHTKTTFICAIWPTLIMLQTAAVNFGFRHYVLITYVTSLRVQNLRLVKFSEVRLERKKAKRRLKSFSVEWNPHWTSRISFTTYHTWQFIIITIFTITTFIFSHSSFSLSFWT